MKKRTKILSVGALALIATAWYFAPAPSDMVRILHGQEGRYAEIATMEGIMDKGEFTNLPHGFYGLRVDYKSGNWIQVISTDSHDGGGTVGVLESSGQRHFYFGHVCGGYGEGVPLTYGKERFEPDQRKFGHDKTDDLEKIK